MLANALCVNLEKLFVSLLKSSIFLIDISTLKVKHDIFKNSNTFWKMKIVCTMHQIARFVKMCVENRL